VGTSRGWHQLDQSVLGQKDESIEQKYVGEIGRLGYFNMTLTVTLWTGASRIGNKLVTTGLVAKFQPQTRVRAKDL
jgi:hypothetical protein